MDDYYTRCTKLKKSINYIESPTLSRKLKMKPKDTGETVIKEIYQIHNSNYTNSMRNELLGNNNQNNGLRKRTGTGEDMGQAMKYYGDMQERLAEDMLLLTRNLKEQTETANKIIKKDTEVGFFFFFYLIKFFPYK